jgi:hypothetical protein
MWIEGDLLREFFYLLSKDTDVQVWILSHVVTILSAVLSCMHLLTYDG